MLAGVEPANDEAAFGMILLRGVLMGDDIDGASGTCEAGDAMSRQRAF